jgi:hypothetical protein
VQGLYSDRIQTIVHSRNQDDFDDIAETALEEECAMVSKVERYKAPSSNPVQCAIYRRTGHTSSNCFAKLKRESRVHKFSVRRSAPRPEVVCFNCGEKRHIAKNFVGNPEKASGREDPKVETAGNDKGLSARNRQPIDGPYCAIGGTGGTNVSKACGYRREG